MFFKRDVVLAQEYLGFLLLNLFDLFLSGYIFRHHGMEANGLAAWVLEHGHGWGFAVYKFLLVLVLVLCCEGISLKSIRTSRLIITVACFLYVLLVFYESFIIFTHITGPHLSASLLLP